MGQKKDLYKQGYTFHRGIVDIDRRFITESKLFPFFVSDLEETGWIIVKGGMMEPPRNKALDLASLAGFAGLCGGIYLLTKYLQGGKS